MENTQTFTGTVSGTQRLSNSPNGNPRYLVTVTGGNTYRTAPDSAVNYKITNEEFRQSPAVFTLNSRGEITHANPA